jgi:hypothetical protein
MDSFTPVSRESQAYRVAQRLSQFIDGVVADAGRDVAEGFHRTHAM